jgi:hypothetical protein
MPTLMWIAFWSSMMGAAACWQEAALPHRRKNEDEDHRHQADAKPSST